jgi:hypothetical protein
VEAQKIVRLSLEEEKLSNTTETLLGETKLLNLNHLSVFVAA